MTPATASSRFAKRSRKANVNPGADVIVVPAGVYKITVRPGEDANATGDFDITGSLTIQGAGAGLTIIDAQQFDRVFDVARQLTRVRSKSCSRG